MNLSKNGEVSSPTHHSSFSQTQRLSNLELLRIVAMFLVLLIHYIPFRGTPSINSLHTDFSGTLFNLELRSLSFVCVNCFIMISGYFGIKWKWRSLFNYLYQVLFWTILAYIIGVVICAYEFDLRTFGHTVACFLSSNWFKLSYLGLFLFAPLLESFIESASQKTFVCFLLFFYIYSTIFGWILQASPELKEGMTFVSLMGLYLIGGYLRKYEHKIFSFNKWVDLFIYLGIGVLLVLLSVAFLLFGVTNSLYGYLNPLIIIESIYLFLFFKKLDIGYKKAVNWVASSVFAVYLFHVSSLYGVYGEICKWIQSTCNYPFVVAILFMLSVFIVAVLLDKIRQWSFKNVCLVMPSSKF